MTVNKLIKRLSMNATEFLLAGEKDKSDACMELLAFIKERGFTDIKGKLWVDNPTESV